MNLRGAAERFSTALLFALATGCGGGDLSQDLCATEACDDAAAPRATDGATSAAPDGVVTYGPTLFANGDARALGPKYAVDCTWLTSRVGASPTLAFATGPTGTIDHLLVLERPVVCRLDGAQTARAFVASAVGLPFMPPSQRTSLMRRVDALDLRTLSAIFEAHPFEEAMTDRLLRASVDAALSVAARSLRPPDHTLVVGIIPSEAGFDGLVLSRPRLSSDGRQIEVEARLDDGSAELKAISVHGAAGPFEYLRPLDVADWLGGGVFGPRAQVSTVLRWPATTREPRLRVVAPTLWPTILGQAESRAQRDLTLRSHVAIAMNVLLSLADLGEGGACLTAVVDLIRERALAVLVNRSWEGGYAHFFDEFLGGPIETALALRECSTSFRASAARGIFERFFARVEAVWGAVDQVGSLGRVASGAAHVDHGVRPCAVCDGATETSLPACEVYAERIVCGAEAECVGRYVGSPCTVGRGACARSSTLICVNATPQCLVTAGRPTTERCTGGVDEDCDGALDCADSNCATDPACVRCPTGPCAAIAGPGTVCSGGSRVTCVRAGACLVESARVDCRTAFPSASGSCSGGTCVLGTCAAGRGNCDGVASNGCEQDTLTSTSHCGACGRRCALGEQCVSGACRSSCSADRCSAGSPGTVALCSGTMAVSCQMVGVCLRESAASDCSTRYPHMTGICRFGTCERGTCESGWADCDGVLNNGCETNLRTTTLHCGACGRACSPSNARGACSNGACAISSCLSGYADCNGSASDGCEVQLATDRANCGRCGNRCSLSCSAGACTSAATCSTRLVLRSPPDNQVIAAGGDLRIDWSTGTCPSTTRYTVRARECCVSHDCRTGYVAPNDPDRDCSQVWEWRSLASPPQVVSTRGIPANANRYRLSVFPVDRDDLAAEFVTFGIR